MLLTKPFFYYIIDNNYVLRNPKYLTQEEKTIYTCNRHEKSKKPHNNTDQYFYIRNLDNYYKNSYIITDRNGKPKLLILRLITR